MSILNKYLSMENQEVADARNEATTEREHVTTDTATEVDVETKAGEVNNDEAPLGDDSNVEKALDKAENQLEAAVESFQHDMKIIESVQNVKTGLDIRKVFPDLKPALETHYVSLEEDKEDNKDGFFMKIFKAIRDAIKWVYNKIVAVFKKIGEWLGLVKKSAEKKVEEAKNPEKVVVAKVNAEVQKEEVKKAQADKMPTDEEVEEAEKAAETSTDENKAEAEAKVAAVEEKLKPTTEAIKAATGVEPVDKKAPPSKKVKQLKTVKKIAEKAKEAPKVKEQEPLAKVATKENLQNLSEDVKKAVRDPKQLKGTINYSLSKEAHEFISKLGIGIVDIPQFNHIFNGFIDLAEELNKKGFIDNAEADAAFLCNGFVNRDTLSNKDKEVLIMLSSGLYLDSVDRSNQISPTKYIHRPMMDITALADLDTDKLSSSVVKLSIKEGTTNTAKEFSNKVNTSGITTGDVVGRLIERMNDNVKRCATLTKQLNEKASKIKDNYLKAVKFLEDFPKEDRNGIVYKLTLKAVQLGSTNAISNINVLINATAELSRSYSKIGEYLLSDQHLIITPYA